MRGGVYEKIGKIVLVRIFKRDIQLACTHVAEKTHLYDCNFRIIYMRNVKSLQPFDLKKKLHIASLKSLKNSILSLESCTHAPI